MRELFAEISPVLRARAATGGRFILVSMAAGLSAAAIAELYGAEVPVVRIMPNTPVSVGAGMVLYATNSSATKEETETLVSALELAGKTHEISEAEMDAASIISGCAPAYVFMFIKALADAGTSLGLDEKSSLLYAEQTVFGSAKLAMESGKAPDERKRSMQPGRHDDRGRKKFGKRRFGRNRAFRRGGLLSANAGAGGQSMRREIAKEPQKSFIFRNIKGER